MLDRAKLWPWTKGYSTVGFRGDLTGGLAVGVMLIPHAMAVAMIAGLPPIVGLYAAVGALLFFVPFATSRRLTVGPVALDSLLVLAVLTQLYEPGSNDYVIKAAALAAIVGALQVGLGLARLGFLVNFLSRPVLSGFMLGAPFIIGLAQLKHLVGIELPQSQQIYLVLAGAARNLGDIHWPTFAVGTSGILIQVALRKWKPMWPDILIMVVLMSIGCWAFGWQDSGVAVVGQVPAGLPMPKLPMVTLAEIWRMLPSAFAIAIIGYMEGIAIAKVFAQKYQHRLDENREMVAIGMGNLGASLFRGYPIGGSFARTAVNDQAGARTPLANLIAAIVVIFTLLFLSRLFYFMPKAVLAAVVIVAVSKFVNVGPIRALFHIKRSDGLLAIATFVATLSLGVLWGLTIGVVASIIPTLMRLARPHAVELGLMPDGREYRDLARNRGAVRLPGIVLLRVDASFCFLNAGFLRDKIHDMTLDRDVRVMIIDASSINDLDSTAFDVLERVVESLQDRGIHLYITGVKGPVRDILKRGRLWEKIGPSHFYLNPHAAVQHIRHYTDLLSECSAGAGI